MFRSPSKMESTSVYRQHKVKFLLKLCPLAAAHEIAWISSIDHYGCFHRHNTMMSACVVRTCFGTPISIISTFWYTDPIVSFTKSSKTPLIARRYESHLQYLPFDRTKVAWLHFFQQQSFVKILVLKWTQLCLKWRLRMIDVTVKKTDKIKHD